MAESSADRRTDADIGKARPSRAFLTSLHPSGDPDAILWIGSTAATKADVVVLTITPAQCCDVAQRTAMIQKALAALAVDGVMWVDVPGRWRSAIAADLRAAGLEIGAPVVWRARGSEWKLLAWQSSILWRPPEYSTSSP